MVQVLIVEDREIIASKVRRVLSDAGHSVVGMAPTLASAAMQLGHIEQVDAAVLDIDLRGEPAYPFAELLESRRIPFIFLTGYGASSIAERWNKVHRVEKPFESATLLRALDDAIHGRLPPRRTAAFIGGSPRARMAMDIIRDTRDAITEARAVRELQTPRPSRPL
jgi:CheY-like chemotaxis protein